MLSLPDFENKQWLVVFSKDGEKVSVQNDNIIIKNETGKIIHQSTCYRLFCLMIVGPVSLTSGLIEKSKRFAFSIFLLGYNFRVYEALLAENRGNTLLRQKQYATSDFEIARQIVLNKVENQLKLLKKCRDKSEGVKTAINGLKNYLEKINHLTGSKEDYANLLGYEGMSSRLYFQNYFEEIGWKNRMPRTKQDIPNLLLDIGYTYLFNIIESLLVLYGFDVYKGIYHQPFYQRKSLVCDLVEPFRPIIDHNLKNAYGLKQIDQGDFDKKGSQYFLPFNKNKKYTQIFVKGLGKYRLEMFRYVQSYYRSFMKEKPGKEFPKFLIDPMMKGIGG